ncbi:MAG: hypothetical protein WC282_01105 [Bacilli bacterium]|jgi:hypothetical protein
MKKPQPQQTYSELHNKAVRLYRKSALFLLWAGIISLLAVVLGLFQQNSGYAMSLAVNILLNRLLLQLGLPGYAYNLLIVAVAIASGALFSALGYFAQLGKKLFLFIGLGLYLADFAVVFIVYEPIWTSEYGITIATHLIILGALFVAVYQYYKVIVIEERFHGRRTLNLDEEDNRDK